MNKIMVAVCALALCSTAAFADSKPSDDEAAKIKATLADWGFEGGTYEKETEATNVFEVDDAKRGGVQYDIKLDSAFKIIAITAD